MILQIVLEFKDSVADVARVQDGDVATEQCFTYPFGFVIHNLGIVHSIIF